QLPGGGVQHSQAVAMAAVQLAGKYGVYNIYADLNPYAPTACGPGRVNLGKQFGPSDAYPDLLKCGAQPYYVWETKPANARGMSDGFTAMGKYVSLLIDSGVIAKPG